MNFDFLCCLKNADGMFSIGLFSTYLPYVILAMFYGLYVGVHSIIKIELGSDIDDKELAAKTIFTDHDDTRPGATGKTCFYDEFIAANDSASDPRIQQIAGGTMLPKPHEDPGGRSYYHPLFSRPPPAISL